MRVPTRWLSKLIAWWRSPADRFEGEAPAHADDSDFREVGTSASTAAELDSTFASRYAAEQIGSTLFDYQPFPLAGAVDRWFFSVPLGCGNPPKTLDDTNIFLSSTLPSGQSFLVHGIELAYLPSGKTRKAKQDYLELGKWGRLELNVGDKSYCSIAPLGRFMRPWRTIEQAGGVTRTEGAPWLNGPLVLSLPLYLSGQMFGVRLAWANGAPALAGRIGVLLHGVLSRPVI